MLNIDNEKKSNKTDGDAVSLFSMVNGGERQRAVNWINDRVRRYQSGDMFTETVTITPTAAEYILLNHNAGNRPTRRHRVADFVKIINEGRWKLNSQGISFSREGLMNNGQHRLQACVVSGRPIDLRVTWGEERDVFDVLDTGAIRGGSDTLYVSGYQNTTVLAAGARLLNALNVGAQQVSNDEVLSIVQRHPLLAAVAGRASGLASKFHVSSAAICVAIFVITRDSRQAERLPEFLEKLADGTMLPAFSPILALRDGLVNKKFDKGIRGGVNRSINVCACFIKAWNAWVRDERMKNLRFSLNENFPAVK